MAVVAVAVLPSIRTSDHHVDPCFLVTGCPRSWSALVVAPAGDARSGLTPKLVVASRRPLTHALNGVEASRLQLVKTGLSPLASESPSPCILSHSYLQTQAAHQFTDTDKIGNAPRIQRS
jgi:hypothetical protein